MNATIHSQISKKYRGGSINCYYDLHNFIDSSKECESSNKHRFLTHTMFFIKQVMIPIFGHTIINSDNKNVNVKDLLEQDHVLADYGGKFIPTLTDFTDNIEGVDGDIIKDFQSDNVHFFNDNKEIKELMMMPLSITGQIKSLFVTHNSWFIGFILPKIYKDIKIELKNYNISPSTFFNKMKYQPWMQNGNGTPPSFEKIQSSRKTRAISLTT